MLNEATHLSRMSRSAATHTYIVLLNWNGWRDTIECMESLLKMNTDNFSIVLCDNASQDGSYEHLRLWAEQTQASRLGAPFFREWQPESAPLQPPLKVPLVLIQTGANLGFAGGCNVGLRYALQQGDGAYFWLLNNDTVVDPDALSAQIHTMQERSSLGILGSTLLFYDEPETVQCCAGYGFNTWTARVRSASHGATAHHLPTTSEVETHLRFVCGASMFVRRLFLEEVGLLNEQYFLYFEEIDWVTRGAHRFDLGYCPQSRILHKEGRSIGSSRNMQKRSLFSERYLSRNRILFTRTHYPFQLPVAFFWTMFVALSRLLKGSVAQAGAVFFGAWSGLFAPKTDRKAG